MGEAAAAEEITTDPTTAGDTSPTGGVRLYPQSRIEGGDVSPGTDVTE